MGALYYAFLKGTITNNPLGASDTSISSSAFTTLPVISAPDYMWIVLDPDGENGTPEICKVTTHTTSNNAVTVTRAQQTSKGGSSARDHPIGTDWVASATPDEFDNLPFRLIAAKGDLLAGTSDKTISRLAVGSNDQVIVADSGQATGLKYSLIGTNNISDNTITSAKLQDNSVASAKIADNAIGPTKLDRAYVEKSGFTTKGDLMVGTNPSAFTILTVGTDQQRLVAATAASSGMKWVSDTTNYVVTTKGDILAATSSNIITRLGVGSNQQILSADSTKTTGLKWDFIGGIPVFVSTASRDSAITSPVAGQACYIDSADSAEGLYFYNGTAWRTVAWNAPWGMVGYVDSAGKTFGQNSSSTTMAEVSSPSMSVTFNAVANRRYYFQGHLHMSSSVANDRAMLAITDGSLTLIYATYMLFSSAGNGQNWIVTGYNSASLGTGSVTRKLGFNRNAGSGTVSTYADGTSISTLTVTDVGPLGAPA